MTITFSINNSPNNQVFKNLTEVGSFEGKLRNETSIFSPTIIITIPNSEILTPLAEANYFYISDFHRKYFLTEFIVQNSQLVKISGEVDVISTYADDIVKWSGIIRKQALDYNMYLNDGSLKCYQNPYIKVINFPAGFSEYNYVMAIAGGGG